MYITHVRSIPSNNKQIMHIIESTSTTQKQLKEKKNVKMQLE